MHLKICLLLCALSGLACAESTEDYFSEAFGRAVPSPFGQPSPAPELKNFFFPFEASRNGNEDLVLPEKLALALGPHQCAIPLLEVPISKDRRFSLLHQTVTPKSAGKISIHPMPTCGR